jgi:nitronate monooxygenase
MLTFLTEAWDLRVPVIGAPMTPQAGGLLAAALSRSGALGMIGLGSTQPVARFEADVEDFRREAGNLPLGVGLSTWSIAAHPELLDAALAAKPFAIALSFGDPAPYAQRVRAAGIELIAQVQDRESALAAEAAGVTLIVAQGTEAGGHTSRLVAGSPPYSPLARKAPGSEHRFWLRKKRAPRRARAWSTPMRPRPCSRPCST